MDKNERRNIFTKKGIEWLREISLKIKEIAKENEDAKLLMTIPGINYYSAMLILAEIGDVKRFSD